MRITQVVYHSLKDGHPHNVYSVIEALEPDMQDYEDAIQCKDKTQKIEILMSFAEVTGGQLKEFLGVLNKNVFQEEGLLREPQNADLYSILSRESDEQFITKVLPYREGPIYSSSFISKSGEAFAYLKEEDALEPVCTFIREKLGIDMAEHYELIGSAHLVWYHPWIRKISLRASDNPSGVLLLVDQRDDEHHVLTVDLADYHKDGSLVQSKNCVITKVSRCQLIPLKQPVSVLDFKIFDGDGDLVYGMKGITFIRQINVNIGIEDSKATGKSVYTERMQIGEVKKDAEQLLREAQHKRETVLAIKGILKQFDTETQKDILQECLNHITE